MDLDAIRSRMTAAEIRRLEDANENPLTGEPRPTDHESMLEARRNLPVRDSCQEILDAYHQNQVFVLSGGTGSGKSTQIPQFLVYDEFSSGLKIACTQPRVVAARSVATRVAEEMGVTLGGEEVGYIVGGESVAKPKTRLAYMTEGVLLNKLASDELLSQYACVIIDEAHERTVQADMLLALLKNVLAVRDDFKVIIMSATVDSKLFQGYFDNCPLVHIDGRNFDVEVLYCPEKNVPVDLHMAAADLAIHIHENDKPGHILIFLPGEAEIKRVCDLVSKYTSDLEVFPLYGQLSHEQQKKALGSGSGSRGRKCVVATNVAETSLTIDGVVYVIDSGLAKQAIYDPRTDINLLETRGISKASANQRKGRAGRTQDGVCYRLYTEDAYDRMMDSTMPAIKSSQIDHAILKLLACGHSNIGEFNWIDHPQPDTLMRSWRSLKQWGFIDEGGNITDRGSQAARCSLDPVWFYAILQGHELGCAQDMVDIACVCSARKSIYLHPEGYRDLSNRVLAKDAFGPSDHIRLTNTFNAWMRQREIGQKETDPDFSLDRWCALHFLDTDSLEQVRVSRDNLRNFLKNVAQINTSRATPLNSDKVRKALALALCTNAAYHSGTPGHEYKVALSGAGSLSAVLEPTSCLVSDMGDTGSSHEWVVFTSLDRRGSKTLMRIATAIKLEWLIDLPAFQDENLPKKYDGSLCKPDLKAALDAVRAKVAASKSA